VLADWLSERSEGGKEDSLGSLIRTSLENWKWNDNKIQCLIMDLHSRYFQCYQLQCVLFANLAYAAHKHSDAPAEQEYKQSFVSVLQKLSQTVQDRKTDLSKRVQELQHNRLDSVGGVAPLHIADPGVLPIWRFNFSDNYSKENWFFDIDTDENDQKGTSRDQAEEKAHDVPDPLRNKYIDLLSHHTSDRMKYMSQFLDSFDGLVSKVTALASLVGSTVVDEQAV